MHACLLLWVYRICSWKPLKSIGCSGNKIASQSFRFCHSWKNKQHLSIFPESSQSFCTGTCGSHFWMRCTCMRERNTQVCSRKYCAPAGKTQSRGSFSEVSWREHYIHDTASWIDLWNQSTFCKNVLCVRKSMAESIDCATAKLSSEKRRHFQSFKKAYHEKWLFATVDEKDDVC